MTTTPAETTLIEEGKCARELSPTTGAAALKPAARERGADL
jgi:hypothetical protein